VKWLRCARSGLRLSNSDFFQLHSGYTSRNYLTINGAGVSAFALRAVAGQGEANPRDYSVNFWSQFPILSHLLSEYDIGCQVERRNSG